MIDLASLFQALALAGIVAAALLAVRWLVRGEPAGLSGLFILPADPPWPRGVQEEEPRPWRLDLLERRQVAPPSHALPADHRQDRRRSPRISDQPASG